MHHKGALGLPLHARIVYSFNALGDGGLIDVLKERHLNVEGKYRECKLCRGPARHDEARESRNACCLVRMMASQPDFASERDRIETVVKDTKKHMCRFF